MALSARDIAVTGVVSVLVVIAGAVAIVSNQGTEDTDAPVTAADSTISAGASASPIAGPEAAAPATASVTATPAVESAQPAGAADAQGSPIYYDVLTRLRAEFGDHFIAGEFSVLDVEASTFLMRADGPRLGPDIVGVFNVEYLDAPIEREREARVQRITEALEARSEITAPDVVIDPRTGAVSISVTSPPSIYIDAVRSAVGAALRDVNEDPQAVNLDVAIR